MKRSPLLARADLLRALALAGGEEDRQRRFAALLCFERASRWWRRFPGTSWPPVWFAAFSVLRPLPKAMQESLCARPCSPSPPANVSTCRPNAPESRQTAAPDAGAMRAPAQRRRSGALRSAGSSRAAVAGAQALGGRNAPRRARHAAPAAPTGRRPTAAPLAAPSPIPLGRRTARRLGSRRTPAALPGRLPGHRHRPAAPTRCRRLHAVAGRRQPAAGPSALAREARSCRPGFCASARGHCHAGAGNAGAAALRRRRARPRSR
jgi:hypothetical protein